MWYFLIVQPDGSSLPFTIDNVRRKLIFDRTCRIFVVWRFQQLPYQHFVTCCNRFEKLLLFVLNPLKKSLSDVNGTLFLAKNHEFWKKFWSATFMNKPKKNVGISEFVMPISLATSLVANLWIHQYMYNPVNFQHETKHSE